MIKTAKNDEIQIEDVIFARNEINERVQASEVLNNILCLSCLFNLLGSIANFYQYVTTSREVILAYCIYLYYMKDFLFLYLVFNEISKVNELSDELTDLITTRIWTKDSNEGNLAMNLHSKPLTFTIFNYRLKRKSIYLQLASFIFASFVGFLKNFINTYK